MYKECIIEVRARNVNIKYMVIMTIPVRYLWLD